MKLFADKDQKDELRSDVVVKHYDEKRVYFSSLDVEYKTVLADLFGEHPRTTTPSGLNGAGPGSAL